MTHIRRKASLKTPKIVVDDLETKEKLLEIGEKKGESIKQTIVRLVNEEIKKTGLNNDRSL